MIPDDAAIAAVFWLSNEIIFVLPIIETTALPGYVVSMLHQMDVLAHSTMLAVCSVRMLFFLHYCRQLDEGIQHLMEIAGVIRGTCSPAPAFACLSFPSGFHCQTSTRMMHLYHQEPRIQMLFFPTPIHPKVQFPALKHRPGTRTVSAARVRVALCGLVIEYHITARDDVCICVAQSPAGPQQPSSVVVG